MKHRTEGPHARPYGPNWRVINYMPPYDARCERCYESPLSRWNDSWQERRRNCKNCGGTGLNACPLSEVYNDQ